MLHDLKELRDIKQISDRLSDREWRIDNLYYIKDKKGEKVLFRRNLSQQRFWESMWFLNIILKDRQRGFSTLIAIFILDYCLFNSGTAAGIIDITLSDAKLKLAKIQYAYNNMPGWVKEMFPQTVENKERIEWANGSSVQVGTSHRGGTLQILHISEKGKISVRFPDRAREIRTGALNTVVPGQFIFEESTAEGSAGEFYEDCERARRIQASGEKLTELDFKFHFFGWWMGKENEIDPDGIFISIEMEKYFAELEQKIKEELEISVQLSDRKKAWYVKKATQQKKDMKREYPGTPSEAFEASVEGAYLSRQINKITKAGQIVDFIPIEPGVPVNTGWDFGLSDTMTIWLHQRVKFQDRVVGYISGTDDDLGYYWEKLKNDYDVNWGYHFFPHDFGYRRAGTAKDPSSPPRTLEEIAKEAGMRNTIIVPRIDRKEAAIAESRLFLLKCYFSKKHVEEGLKCLQNYRREWDENNGCWKNRPRHDWASHGYDGFESLARGLAAFGAMPMAEEERMKKQRRKLPPINWKTI